MSSRMSVTGTLSPDATGVYANAGTHNGVPYYKLVGQEWYLWWTDNPATLWTISTVAGTEGAAYWSVVAASDAPEDTYSPQGTATGDATVAILDRYWLGTTDTDNAVAANWATTSGGAGGASVPGTGNPVFFDANGNNACTFTANMTHGGFTTAAGYTVKLDLATFDLTGDTGVNVTLDQGGEFDRGTGTITCSGDFDCVDVTTFTDGGGLLVLNGTANQTLAAGVHDIGDVEINKPTSGTVDITSGTMQLADVDIADAGGLTITGSTITSTADAKAITGAFDIGAADNNVNLGTATWTLTDCALDYDDIGTLTATSAAVVFAGTCTIQSDTSPWFAPMTVAASGTTTVLAAGENFYPYGMVVNGALSIESGRTVLCSGGYNIVLNTGGRITGGGTCRLHVPKNTSGLTVHNGIIDVAVFEIFKPAAGAVVAPGTFSCTDRVKVDNNSASNYELELSGDYIFDCDFEVENTGAGDMEIKNSTNSPNLTFQKDVIRDEQAGSITWTKGSGTVTFAAANAQDADFGAAAIEAIVVNKTSVTDELTFSGGWTATSFTATKGTLDFNGQTLETVGNWTMGTDSQVVSDADAMNGTAITVGGALSLTGENGDLLTFSATAAWTNDVTGAATATYTSFAYCNALGGTQINAATPRTNVNSGNNKHINFTINPLIGGSLVNRRRIGSVAA